MEFANSNTAKALRVVGAARQLARDYDAEGKPELAAKVRSIATADFGTLARLADLLGGSKGAA